MSAIPLADISSRVLMGVHGWTVLVCPESSIEQIAQELVAELKFLTDDEPESTVCLLIMGTNGLAFVDELTRLPLAAVCVVQANAANLASTIGFVEASRGRLVAGPNVVVVTDDAGARGFAANAPNLWSWVGSRMWSHVNRIATVNVDARLESFRAATGKTDNEVIELAESGQLSPDPVYAEWLALLGRGDLLGN